MRKYVIIGVQGSGKGTQAGLLAEAYELEHIDVGAIFRWNVRHHTKLGAQVRRIIAAGELVDDDLVGEVVRTRLDAHDWNYGFVIDGFPRNAVQAEFFLETYDIDGVIHLDVPDEVVKERLMLRRDSLDRREDDTPEVVAARLRDYHEKTTPVLDLFERKEVVVSVDGTRPAEQVQEDIRLRLGLKTVSVG